MFRSKPMSKVLSKLLQEAKKLNIPRRNYVKKKQEREKAMVKIQRNYQESSLKMTPGYAKDI